jgi:hypothetical protein
VAAVLGQRKISSDPDLCLQISSTFGSDLYLLTETVIRLSKCFVENQNKVHRYIISRRKMNT